MADDGLFSDIAGGQPSGGLFDDITAPQPEPEPEPPRGPSTPVTRFVRQGEAAPERPLPGFGESVIQGLGTTLRGGAETAEDMLNRLRGQPMAEPTETIGDPRVEEIKPSEALTSGEKFPSWAGYMLGRSAPAAIGAVSGGAAFGLLGEIGGGALSQFVTDYGPRFRENVDAGMPEDQALRAALKSSGVSAAATGASFGVPLTVLKQVLLQPTVGAGELVIQNYLAGRPLTEGIEEALLGGLAGAVPVIGAKGVTRGIRAVRDKLKGEAKVPEAPPAEPPAEPPSASPTPPAEEVTQKPGETPAAPAEPPQAGAPPPPTPGVPPDLFDWMIRGGEGEPPAAPEAVRGPAPRVRPEIPREPTRAEPPAPSAPTPTPPEVSVAPAEPRVPERAAPPERPAGLFDDITGEPPAWVTERIPEEARPAEPPAERPRAQEPAAPAAPAEPLARRTRKEKQPQSLLQFIAMNGGISAKDPMVADVRAIIGKKNKLIPGYGSLIRENGRPLDRILENAVEGRYIEDPGFWQQNVPRTTTIRDLLDAIDNENRGVRQIPRGEEAAAAPPRADERAPEMEANAQRVRDSMKEAGFRDADVDPEAVYEAADSLYRGEATDPVAAYDQAVVRREERDFADRTGVRRGGEEVPAPGEPGAGPRVEEALPAARAEPSRAREAGEPPRKEIPQEGLAAVPKRQAMARKPAEPGGLFEPGAEGKPQAVIPGTERDVAGMLQRKAEAPLKPKAPQKPMDVGLFGDEAAQLDIFGRPVSKLRREGKRGRSGRLVKTKPLPIGTEEAILEKGYERATGPKGEPREPGIEPLIRDAADEVLTDKLILHNHSTLSKIAGYLGGTKINPTAIREYLQDKFLRIKRMQEQWLRDNPGQPLPENMDTYQAEALSHGKIDKRMRDAKRDLIEPLVKEINGNGLTWDEIGEYAKAKHAQERNRDLRRINPNLFSPDPAGMSDAAAQSILAAARPRQGNFDAAYTALRKLIDATIDMQVRDGLLSPQMAAAWRQRWPDYVPLRHTETGERWIGVGKGLEVRGKEYKQAFGRLTPAENPIQFAVHQLERAIIRGEHNRVGQTLGEFVRNTPEPDLWQYNQGPKERYLNTQTGQVEERIKPNWRSDNQAFTWKENGVEKSVWFSDKDYGAKIVRALKSLDEPRQNVVMRALSGTTRLLARLSTSWNPEFMLSNFIRDAGEAFINLPGDTQRKFSASFIKNLPGAMYGAMHGQWPTGGGKYAQYFREFERAGGRIGFYGARTVEEAGADVQRQLQRLQGGTINTLAKWRDKTLNAIDIANTGVENGTRLAVYIAALDAGLSEGKAAFMARESTVNFNRRGQARWLSGLYMFANAGLQGTVRSAQALKTSPRARKAAAWLAASGATLAMYNIMAGGTDEDGRSKYSKIPEWERDLNFILMSPDGSGSYAKIPKPFVFGMFAGMGEHLASWMWDQQSLGKTASAIGWNMLQAVDPLGQDQGLAHFFPTLLKPAVQLYTNVGPFGTPIRPDAMPWNKHLPESERRPFRSTSQFSQGFAKQLNELSGGTKTTPGLLDTAPGNIDYLMGYASGGLGRFALNMWNSGTRLYQGQEWVPEKFPFARRFYGEPKPQADKQLYYEAKKEVDAAVQRKTPGPGMGAAEAFKNTEKARKGLQKQTDAINARTDLEPAEKDDLVKELEQNELRHMLNARRVLERNKARAEGREPTFAVGGLVQVY